MAMTKLYGRGAVTLTDDRREYRPVNGVLEVPDHLVTRAKAAGFTAHPLPEMQAEAEAAAVAASAPAVASSAVPPVEETELDETGGAGEIDEAGQPQHEVEASLPSLDDLALLLGNGAADAPSE